MKKFQKVSSKIKVISTRLNPSKSLEGTLGLLGIKIKTTFNWYK